MIAFVHAVLLLLIMDSFIIYRLQITVNACLRILQSEFLRTYSSWSFSIRYMALTLIILSPNSIFPTKNVILY